VKWLKSDGAVALLVGLAAFALYALTAAPTVATVFDDSLEFHVVLPTLGIAHPSGYPLYTLLGWLASALLPFGDPAGRINLLSAAFAAAAVAALFLVARRFAGSRPAALVGAAIFALTPTWWSQATIAEVYALHGLLVAVFIYCLLRWEEGRLMGRRTGAGADRWLRWAALTMGLGMAHHRMIALLLPAALVFIFWTDPALPRQPRRWIAPLLLGFAPLLLYLYLPLRGQSVSSLDGTYEPTLRGTMDWVLARDYSIFLTGNPFNIERGWSDYLALVLGELGALTVIAAIIGISRAFTFHQRRAVFLLLATISQIAFAAAYKVQDVAVFFIPAFMLLCVWAAWGLAAIFDQMAQRGAHAGGAARLPAKWMPALVLLWMLPVAFVMLFEPARDALREWPERNRRDDWQVYDQGRDMIDSAAPGGRIVGLGGEVTLIRYFRDVLRERPDLGVSRADAEAERLAAVEGALAQGETPYITRDLPGIAARFSLDAVGPLIRVSPKAPPSAAPDGGQPLGLGVTLLDAQVGPLPGRARGARFALTWTAAGRIAEELKVSARLLNAAGEVVASEDAVPARFTYPTTAWVPGETVEDALDARLGPDAAAGPYTPLIILYRGADGSEVGRATLEPIALE
jgi:4-amino-4-deoxy-L-arabinose transferase-like glycosyltransferase